MFVRNSRTLSLMLLVAAGACSDSITGPQVGPAPEMLFSHTTDPLPQTHTYTFDECDTEDLTVEVLVGTAECVDGVFVLGPFTHVRITLGGTAESVDADVTGDAMLLALNEDQLLAGPGQPIRYVDILTVFEGGTFDNLVVDYVTVDEPGEDPEDPAVPTTREECKDGGWQNEAFETLGFKNQGQCVRFVETGKDPVA